MSLVDELLTDLLSDEEDSKVNLWIIEEEEDDEADCTDNMALDGPYDEHDALSNIIIREIDDLKKLARIVSSETMDTVLHRIDQYGTVPGSNSPKPTGHLEDDPEYRLVVEATALSAELDQETILVNKFLRDHYRLKFPELETLVRNPLDYAKTVHLIGNEMNIVNLDFAGVLTPASTMVVKTAATTTQGQPLSSHELALVMKSSEMALNIDTAKRKILQYVQSRMSLFAPNLSALIGTQTAANLIGATGGLNGLATTPASNLATLGAKRATGTGFAISHTEGAQGFLYHSELIHRVPHDYRRQAQRRVSGKITLVARADAEKSFPDGSYGRQIRQKLDIDLRKLTTPPEHRGPRALPPPLEPTSKKRGGKRVRRAKEKTIFTDMRKAQNRMKFAEPEEEVGFGDEMEGLGMLTQRGSVRAFTVDNRTKAKVGKKMLARLGRISGSRTRLGDMETPVSGLQSCLAFTPLQGIELVNPRLNDAVREDMLKKANNKWFQGGTFTQIRKEPTMMLPPPIPNR
jgi:U4/U6 small nuclear ribonucleoprotein PRP31